MEAKSVAPRSAGLRQSLEILQLLAGTETGISFNELRRLLGDLPASTVSRLLKVLIDEEWVVHAEDGRYVPGASFRQAALHLHGRQSRAEQLTPLVHQLAADSGETAAFVEFSENTFVFRVKKEMPDSYHHIPEGQGNPDLVYNGYGIMCLAYQSRSLQEKVVAAQAERCNEPLKARLQRMAQIRDDAYYCSYDKGIRFLAPVFLLPQKVFVGVIGISAMRLQIEPSEAERFRALVIQAAQDASTRISPSL